jgi:hypothetical protein
MRHGLIITAAWLAAALGACSGEEPTSAGEPSAAPAREAAAPAATTAQRTGVLRDPTSEQVRAVAADWLGRPLDHEAMARAHPDHQRAAADERPAVLARLAGESRAAAQAGTGIGVLDVSTPISGVSYDPAAGVYLLPVFSPGSTISLAPSHVLRLSNAEAAYALGMTNPAAQTMQSTRAQPARVRLTARLESAQPTANGAVLIGRLESFTLYDAQGGAIGESVSMAGAAAS